MKIGELIRNQRKALGMTQKNLADIFRVSASYVSEWEKETRPVPEKWIPLLAKTLNCTEPGIKLAMALSSGFVKLPISNALDSRDNLALDLLLQWGLLKPEAIGRILAALNENATQLREALKAFGGDQPVKKVSSQGNLD